MEIILTPAFFWTLLNWCDITNLINGVAKIETWKKKRKIETWVAPFERTKTRLNCQVSCWIESSFEYNEYSFLHIKSQYEIPKLTFQHEASAFWFPFENSDASFFLFFSSQYWKMKILENNSFSLLIGWLWKEKIPTPQLAYRINKGFTISRIWVSFIVIFIGLYS